MYCIARSALRKKLMSVFDMVVMEIRKGVGINYSVIVFRSIRGDGVVCTLMKLPYFSEMLLIAKR